VDWLLHVEVGLHLVSIVVVDLPNLMLG
jgi:hypothetical protein